MSRTRVGLCGFTMAMEDYALHFPVVEIQHTFYQPPKDVVMQRWMASTPRTLELTMKAWQLVTHPGSSPTYRRTTRPLTSAERADAGFFRDTPIVAEGLARSLECTKIIGATAMLFQCPSSFKPTDENVQQMRAFFQRAEKLRPPGLRFLWEPRGAEWVRHREKASALCAELGLVHVVDPFVTPPSPGPVYFRLHGITGARHVYTDAELVRLGQLLEDAREPTASEPAYVMFNNIPRVGDAKRFIAFLAAR